jgi:ABC-type branched-subunit amino acid transport system substrate-binding protein
MSREANEDGRHRMKFQKWLGGLFACLLTAALAGCGSSGSSHKAAASSSSSSSSKSSFVIAYVGDFSGPTKIYGEGQWGGLTAVQAYINSQHGGFRGDPVRLVKLNDNGDPSTAVSVLSQYISSHPKPALVYAGSSGTETEALLPVLQRAKILGIAQTDENVLAAGAASHYPDEFSSGGSVDLPDLRAALWFKSRGFTKVGILEEETGYSASETPLITAALKKNGITPTVVTFSSTATNTQPQLSELKSDHVQALFAETLGASTGYALTGRASLNWYVPLLGDPAFAAIDPTTLVPAKALKDVYAVFPRAAPASASYAGIKLINKYLAVTHENTPTTYAGGVQFANTWDAVLSVYDASTHAPSVTTNALANAMLHLPAAPPPYFVLYTNEGFSNADHENVRGNPSDFVILPAGKFVDGQVTKTK